MGHCPPHFYAVDFDSSSSQKKISDWIYENLKGRFYCGDVVDTSNGSQLKIQMRAAFEIHSEASYFALVLSDINKF